MNEHILVVVRWRGRWLEESKTTTDLQTRKSLAEVFDGSGTLGITNLLVAFLQRVSLETLPGQGTPQEVHKHVTQGFEVVSARLF